MSFAIRVDNLGKQYRLGLTHAGSIRELVNRTWKRLLGRRETLLPHEHAEAQALAERQVNEDGTFWALRDVSFEVQPGEVVGIIGRNGSGKSTLLKILSQITAPTAGRVELQGRVASLLEVGTGFHPELSGRENMFLNGAILGMTKREIRRKFDEIVTFAEIEKFIDTPVKRYSSGMYVRLAFAVAAHLEPEIMVIDEVLAVGDAAFQKKCLGKMGEVARAGRTVLFVSHNMVAVQNLCNRGLLLENGIVKTDGTVWDATQTYLHSSGVQSADRQWPDRSTAPGNDKVRLHAARIVPDMDVPVEAMTEASAFSIVFEYWSLQPDVRLNLSMSVANEEDVCVFVSTTINEPAWDGKLFPVGRYQSICRVPGNLLNSSTYRVSILFVQDTTTVLFREDAVIGFEIHDSAQDRGDWHGKWAGVVRPKLNWATQIAEQGA
jgi:lipopolysaccharide transport system ATP-binding protein